MKFPFLRGLFLVHHIELGHLWLFRFWLASRISEISNLYTSGCETSTTRKPSVPPGLSSKLVVRWSFANIPTFDGIMRFLPFQKNSSVVLKLLSNMPIKFRIHVVLRTIIAAWNTLNLGKRIRYIFDRKEIKRCKHKSLTSKSVVSDFFSQQCKKLNYYGVPPPTFLEHAENWNENKENRSEIEAMDILLSQSPPSPAQFVF